MRTVVFDADVLGRQRTGDETHVANLLREVGRIASGLRIVALTRRPDLVPEGVEPYRLDARVQEVRMALAVPRALRRLRPDLVHFQHVLPPFHGGPAVVTVHDLSFERDASSMGRFDRLLFRTLVPRAVRRARRVLAVSERTRRDLEELYRVPPEKIVVTPNGVDPRFAPGGSQGSYLLYVGAIEERKDPLAALDAARDAGMRLVVVGPERDGGLARRLEAGGADVRGYVEGEELARLYREAAALVFPSRYEGFGLPVLEAMASGTPVVATPDAAVREVAADAALYAQPAELGAAVRRAVAERARLAAAGLERARLFSWEAAARTTLAVYEEVLGS
ncbi:MAG TPA: glycosyltransferase family 1 protein [Gaiellaceae bacterium]|nr:glycosyltransferase family 1 protein [Gaiellaceae bacterium]